MERKKRVIIGAAAAAALLIAVCLLIMPKEAVQDSKPEVEHEDRETYQLSYVTRGDLELWAGVTCKFLALEQEKLRFEYDGREIGEVYVEVGDRVEKGQLLAELKNKELDDELERAEENAKRLHRELDFARDNLEIVRYSAGMYSQRKDYEKTVDRLTEDSEIADLRLEELTQQKKSESVYAGIDGTVTYIRKSDQSSVNSEMVVITGSGDACFYADTEYYDFFTPGTKVVLTTNSGDVHAVSKSPKELGFEDEPAGINGKKRVYFVPTDGGELINDATSAKLEVMLDSRRDVLIVRERAVTFAGDSAYVFYENEKGVREAKKVELGLHAGNEYEVLSGLEEGEALIAG